MLQSKYLPSSLSDDDVFTSVSLSERMVEAINSLVEKVAPHAHCSVKLEIARDAITRRGRSALRRLLRRENRLFRKWTRIVFPQQDLSLTHSGEVAIAAAARLHATTGLELVGTGIDFEQPRAVNPRTARFFLQPSEIAWLSQLRKQDRNHHLLRLWTVKEALFKSDITNRTESRFPGQYLLHNPSEFAGFAQHPSQPDVIYAYATTTFDNGPVSLAVALRRHQ